MLEQAGTLEWQLELKWNVQQQFTLRDNKLHFRKLATHQKVARSFAAFQAERISTLCARFVSTGGCSRGERWFPWLPGADFSTTQPYLACCTGNQICLSGTLSPSPAFGTIHKHYPDSLPNTRRHETRDHTSPISILLSEEV